LRHASSGAFLPNIFGLPAATGSREDARVSTGKHLPAWDKKAMEINRADVAELVDARNLKSPGATEIAHLSDLTQVAVSRRKFAS
jgi:hypothetical protein